MAKKKIASPKDPTVKKAKPISFFLDEISQNDVYTKPMFGCLAIYRDEKIYFILRETARGPDHDNGIWLVPADTESRTSLKLEFPQLSNLEIFGPSESHWQVLSLSDPHFETLAFKFIELFRSQDPRLGKIPQKKKAKTSRSKKMALRKKR